MFRKHLNLFVLILLAYYANITASECVEGHFYPHPDNCQLFYKCSNNVLYETSCPAGMYFNPDINDCDDPANVKCESQSSTVTESTTPQSTTVTESTTPQSTTVTESTTPQSTTVTESTTTQTTTVTESTTTQSTTVTEPITTTEIPDDTCPGPCINYIDTELDSLLTLIEEVEAKAIALESKSLELEAKTIELELRSSEIELKAAQMEVVYTELVNVVNDIKSSAITNMRLVDLERAVAWRDYGFQDQNGWVITGVINYNSDDLIDFVERRRVQIHVNGTWVGIV